MWSPSRVAEQRAAKRKSGAFVYLNLWPFAAVLVVLLAFFMLRPLPIVHWSGGVADLPTSKSAVEQRGANREDSIRVLVTRDGAIYIEHKAVPLDALAATVQSAICNGAEKKVYLSADARAKNGDVEQVVDELRRAGITQIAFLTN